MTAKQLPGTYSKDGSKYGTLTNGSGTVSVPASTISTTAKPHAGSQAPDGSIYFTLTNGQGTLV